QPPAAPPQPGPPAGYGYPPPAHGSEGPSPAHAAPPYQEAPYQEAAGYPESPYREAPYQEPAYQEPAYQESAYQEPVHQGAPYQEHQGAPQQGAPYQEAAYQEAPHQGAPYPGTAPREDSGPVYAQPGPTRRGDEFGTSFHLAPPMPPQQAQPPQGQAPEQVRSTWFAVVAADREYFTEMMARSGPEAAGLFFPPYCPERRIPLTGRGQLRIGRRSQHRGTVPEIDLSVPPEDPGASHQHALLAEQADGSWVLVDQDSTNGTTVNGGGEPIAPHTAIPLGDGDRVHVGAWTTITLHRA
ncbi:FHA domain-containing protein, partial [Kitasatospora sp. NPDC001574]